MSITRKWTSAATAPTLWMETTQASGAVQWNKAAGRLESLLEAPVVTPVGASRDEIPLLQLYILSPVLLLIKGLLGIYIKNVVIWCDWSNWLILSKIKTLQKCPWNTETRLEVITWINFEFKQRKHRKRKKDTDKECDQPTLTCSGVLEQSTVPSHGEREYQRKELLAVPAAETRWRIPQQD